MIRNVAFLLLMPGLALAAEFNMPVAPNGTGYSCWFGDEEPTRHQRYGTALRACIEKQLADPTQGYEILMREVAGPVTSAPPTPDLTYRSTAPSEDSIHPDAPAGSRVEVHYLEGADIEIRPNGSPSCVGAQCSVSVAVDGGTPEVWTW